ncbi:unnamed protein product, partial [Coregonus sp. 'balchen']
IREELQANGIDVYLQKEEMIPFAVVGSDQEYQVNGKKLLGRKTKTHMQNITNITSSIHYEVYCVHRLNETNAQPNSQPLNTLVNPQPQQANAVTAQF